MKKKFLLLFLVLTSTALAMKGYTIQSYIVFMDGVYNNSYTGSNPYVTTNPVNFNAGDQVELIITPPTGYVLDDLDVSINVTKKLDVYIRAGIYQFTVPASPNIYDIYVAVNFERNTYTPHPVTIIQPIRHGFVSVNQPSYYIGDIVNLAIYPDPNYVLDKITATLFSGKIRGLTTPVFTTIDYPFFTMPDRPVEVFATFKWEDNYVPPYTLRVAKPHAGINYTKVEVNGIERRYPSRADTYWNYYDSIDCNDYIKVTNFPFPDYWTMLWWAVGYSGASYYNDCVNSNTFAFDMPCCDCELDYQTYYGPYKINIEPSANGKVTTESGRYYANAYDNVNFVGTADPGYFVNAITVTWPGYADILNQSQNQMYPFTMPWSDVWEHSSFEKKTYTITLAPNRNCIVQANNKSTGITANNIGNNNTLNAQIGDEIELSHTLWASNLEFVYYIIKKTSDGSVIGATNSDFRRFTMPPCDLTISAYLATPPVMEVVYTPLQFAKTEEYIDIYGKFFGKILLHLRTDLEDPSKSREFTGWDDEENYGWSTAVPGEPMYFTVVPEAGYQVKKSDINVKLLAVSENEDGEAVVLEDCVVQEGFDISGPDDYVTEPTDFSFIFDVPDGYNPCTVQVAFDATFTPVDYNITVNPGIEHGTIMAPATARMDDLVTFSVIPEPDYRLTSITITSETSGLFQAVADDNNQFTMPACDVLVSAEFKWSSFLPGDVDNDGLVGISDVTALIDYILSGDESLISLDGADCDQNGYIDISDVTTLIDYILCGYW